MIPRPVNRPRPIPFDAPQAERSAGPVQPVHWAQTTPAATVLSANEPAPGMGQAWRPAQTPPTNHSAQAMQTARLSPVRAAPATTHALGAPLALAPRPRANAAAAKADSRPADTDPSARFVGQGSLSVRSSVTGRHYRFQGHGDCQKIDKHDTMLLRRIADLVVS
jgi:hypothetical protein